MAAKVDNTPANCSHRRKKRIGSGSMGDGLIPFAIFLSCEAKQYLIGPGQGGKRDENRIGRGRAATTEGYITQTKGMRVGRIHGVFSWA